MYAVAFKSQDNKQIDLSVVGDAGYALILPWMVIPVSQIVLTQVVSGSSTVVARAAIGREIPDLKHLALTVDGNVAKVYFRGRLLMVGTLSTTMTIDRVELQGGTKDTLLSEMLLMPRVAEPEDIKTWWNLRAPFYDPSPVVYKDQIPYAGDWDSKNKTYYDPNPPTGASVGDLWVDTDDNNHLYRWDGNQWVDIQDKSPIPDERIPSAEEWDRKARTFYQSSPPTASAVGDLWFDTSDNDKPRRWDGQNWVDASDKSPIPDERIPSAESWSKKNRTYYQTSQPSGSHSLGDVWFNTAEHNKRYWWDGSKWVDAEDVSPIDASQRPVTARGLGGDIEMDKDGMRFIRKADNEVTLQMDIETGSAFFKGDITGASGTFSGELAAKSIKAEWFEEIRNVLPYVGADSLDQNYPIEVDFYIPSETTNIVQIMLSAKGLRYRAYARTAAAGGSHTHSVTVPGHTHTLTVSTKTYNSAVTKSGGAHTHGIGGVTGSTQTIASLTLSQDGAHSHSLGAGGLGLPTSNDAHSHTASASSAGGHTHTLAISEYKHTHEVSGNVSSVSNHTHGISVTTGSHSHSHSGSISSSGSHAHILEISSVTHYHTVSGTTTSSNTHSHTGSTRTTGYTDVGNHTHTFTTDSASHSHTVSGNTAASGGHTHSVDLTTAQDAHSHTGSSIGAVSDHAHTITVGSHTHSHNVTGTTTTSATHGGHVTDVSYAGHTHGIPEAGAHTHEFAYVDTEVGSVTGTTSITVDTTSVSETHTHDLIYNIALDTTPANVRLYCDNGSGYDAGQDLASAPGNNTQEYVLATELDLTNRFSGTGWKRIKFASSRRGRIVWQLIIKLDLTA